MKKIFITTVTVFCLLGCGQVCAAESKSAPSSESLLSVGKEVSEGKVWYGFSGEPQSPTVTVFRSNFDTKIVEEQNLGFINGADLGSIRIEERSIVIVPFSEQVDFSRKNTGHVRLPLSPTGPIAPERIIKERIDTILPTHTGGQPSANYLPALLARKKIGTLRNS